MKLNPYLLFTGNAKEAIAFYASVFNASCKIMTYGEGPEKTDDDWKDKVLHCSMEFDKNLLMISDGFKGYEAKLDGNIQLSLEVNSIEKINEIFEKMSEGGKVSMPLQDTFWGARFEMLQDKFGTQWMFSYELKK